MEVGDTEGERRTNGREQNRIQSFSVSPVTQQTQADCVVSKGLLLTCVLQKPLWGRTLELKVMMILSMSVQCIGKCVLGGRSSAFP